MDLQVEQTWLTTLFLSPPVRFMAASKILGEEAADAAGAGAGAGEKEEGKR